MTAAATVVKRIPLGVAKMATFTVVFTGTYATNGDTLSLATVNPYGDGRVPDYVSFNGVKGLIYKWSVGSSDATGLIRVYTDNAGGTNSAFVEHTNAACVAGATTDTITGLAIWTALTVSV